MHLKEDKWLSEVLGQPAFAIEEGNAFDEILFKESCAGFKKAFYYVKLAPNPGDELNLFFKNGFRLVNIGVTLENKVGTAASRDLPESDVLVREWRQGDEVAIKAIASTVFKYDRFHCDPLIPKPTADKLKENWMMSYMDGRRGERMVVAEYGGQVQGFLGVMSKSAKGKAWWVIDLMGVAALAQGKGIGYQMVMHVINKAHASGHDVLVSTQLTNIPSINLYEKCGFRFSSSMLVLHAHIDHRHS